MYGKVFSSMFTGSMYGAGAAKFAVMSYVVANMKPDATVGFQVELNIQDLANRIGEPEKVIQEAIDYLCSPDPESRTEAEQGRRLVKVGKFDYRVVNGVKYDDIKNEQDRREKNRIRQERFRKKSNPMKKFSGTGKHPNEIAYLKAEQRGASQEELDRIITDGLPPGLREEPTPYNTNP